MRYELYYWPQIQGRGEFVRLALEEAGADYVDVARLPERRGGGMRALLRFLDDPALARPAFAPPFLVAGRRVVGQTANILLFLGPRLGIAPRAEADRLWAHQLQLTVADLVEEIHGTHHPIAGSLYYEDQKPEARRKAALFVAERLPRFLGYFERVLERNPRRGGWLVGARLGYPDLSLFQIVEGLRYAFPQAMARLERRSPRLVALRDRVAERPNLAAYLASERRIPFDEQGIFRHYPELEGQGRGSKRRPVAPRTPPAPPSPGRMGAAARGRWEGRMHRSTRALRAQISKNSASGNTSAGFYVDGTGRRLSGNRVE